MDFSFHGSPVLASHITTLISVTEISFHIAVNGLNRLTADAIEIADSDVYRRRILET
jgi:hypothetical protein